MTSRTEKEVNDLKDRRRRSMTAAAVAQLTEAVLALAVVALAVLPLRLPVAVLLPCK
jgi:hypothetical protein